MSLLNEIYKKQYEQSLQKNKKNKRKRKLEAVEHIDRVLKNYKDDIDKRLLRQTQMYELECVRWKHSNPNCNHNSTKNNDKPIKPTFKSISKTMKLRVVSVGLLQSIRDCVE